MTENFKRNKYDTVSIDTLGSGFVLSYSVKNEDENWIYVKKFVPDSATVAEELEIFCSYEIDD